MSQVKNPVLYFFLLVLRGPFDLTPDVVHKCNRFSETFLEKSLEIVSCRGSDLIIFGPGLMLLPPEVDPILEKQGCKRDVFMTLGSSGFKIVLALLTELVVFHVEVSKI